MAISGLVIQLENDPELAANALRILEGHPSLDFGEPAVWSPNGPNRVSAVLDTADSREDVVAFDWMKAVAGVASVDIVFVSLQHSDDREEVKS